MDYKAFRLQIRFLIPLIITLLIAAYVSVPILDQVTLRWFSRDLSSRALMLSNALSDSIIDSMMAGNSSRLRQLFDRTAQDERLHAIGLCNVKGEVIETSTNFPKSLNCADAFNISQSKEPHLNLTSGMIHVSSIKIKKNKPYAIENPYSPEATTNLKLPNQEDHTELKEVGLIILLQDLSFIERRSQDTKQYLIGLITALGLMIAMVTMIVAQLSWRGWIKGVQALFRGEMLLNPIAHPPELEPLAADLRLRLRKLEEEYRNVVGTDSEWTPSRLQEFLNAHLNGEQIIVVSNREPYINEHIDDHIIIKKPASGLVTALEPIVRACAGTWIAHGSGSADKNTVDTNDRIKVPESAPEYCLRRIWLNAEEEQGYYYGFANEGMWPLCHVAHVRPIFRESDWQQYQKINQRFADAVIQESCKPDPIVLVQDYHLALLPQMIRDKLPKATILTFWHIPWPNPESFGICPWKKEILHGLLGSDILGFHTKYHCKNFIETVDRTLEARIEHEHSIIALKDKETLVESYPISIEWPSQTEASEWLSIPDCRKHVFNQYGLPEDTILAVGVDRFDYTKGILERLHAISRFLEKYPEWVGRFVFLQVAAPTRDKLDEYARFQEQIQSLTAKINSKFGLHSYHPIILVAKHHDRSEINTILRAANVCILTSLHDGMNLVCKEFVATRNDLQGVLILSRFAGAAREMTEALIVNPYHVEETADAIFKAVNMPRAEQHERMISLRNTVREFNVFRWAGKMLTHAIRWRLRTKIETRLNNLN